MVVVAAAGFPPEFLNVELYHITLENIEVHVAEDTEHFILKAAGGHVCSFLPAACGSGGRALHPLDGWWFDSWVLQSAC